MAFTRYHNISGSSAITTELIASGSKAKNIKSIVITNTHASADAAVTLFLQTNPADAAPSTFNMLSTVSVPVNTSLLLDNQSMISFDNSKFGLYITVGSTDTVDVLINN
jgi:hypothetical protein|tara:strand:+ start:81 stop:407 length:327 start_codon:yes stop_codon:yes gene_type:complete